MSIIKKTDVKNHLSARHRTEIHLEPPIHADATSIPHDEDADAKPGTSGEPESDAISPQKRV